MAPAPSLPCSSALLAGWPQALHAGWAQTPAPQLRLADLCGTVSLTPLLIPLPGQAHLSPCLEVVMAPSWEPVRVVLPLSPTTTFQHCYLAHGQGLLLVWVGTLAWGL